MNHVVTSPAAEGLGDQSRGATRPGRNGSIPGSQSRGGPGLVVDEVALLRRYATTRDPQLKEELVRRFLPLARSLALRYRAHPRTARGFVQVASLGLVKALDGFDPERGDSFKAYAAPTILGELRRHFRDRVWELRLPRKLQERTMVVREVAAALSEELGRTATVCQIAERVELSEEEVLEAFEADAARHTLSLDAPRGHEGAEPQPMIETVGGPEPGYGPGRAAARRRGGPAHRARARRASASLRGGPEAARDRPPPRGLPNAGLAAHAQGASQGSRGGAGGGVAGWPEFFRLSNWVVGTLSGKESPCSEQSDQQVHHDGERDREHDRPDMAPRHETNLGAFARPFPDHEHGSSPARR